MKSVVQEPEETEKALLDAGFAVACSGEGFVVSLSSRRIMRAEVADVLGCEVDDLGHASGGVLVR